MRNHLFITIALMMISQLCCAQSMCSEFHKALNANDTISENNILKKWEQASPESPDLYKAYFNYYLSKGRKQTLVWDKSAPAEDSKYLELTDSLGNYVGHLHNEVCYDENYLRLALDKIDKGIKKYPNRLDMRVVQISLLEELGNWDSYTRQVIKLINYSNENNNNWTIAHDEPLANGSIKFLEIIQGFQSEIYDTGDHTLIPYMQDIARTVLKYHPNNVENLTNLAIGYLVLKDYDSALKYLLKAENIRPRDCIVLMDIAYAYTEKNDKAKAMEYYYKVEKYGNEKQRKQAKVDIENLNK